MFEFFVFTKYLFNILLAKSSCDANLHVNGIRSLYENIAALHLDEVIKNHMDNYRDTNSDPNVAGTVTVQMCCLSNYGFQNNETRILI